MALPEMLTVGVLVVPVATFLVVVRPRLLAFAAEDRAAIDAWTPEEYEARCAFVLLVLYYERRMQMDRPLSLSHLAGALNEVEGREGLDDWLDVRLPEDADRSKPCRPWTDLALQAVVSRLVAFELAARTAGRDGEPSRYEVLLTQKGVRQAERLSGTEQEESIFVDREKGMTMERNINIGAGAVVSAPVVIADSIERSFDTMQASAQEEGVKILLTRLLSDISGLARAGEDAQVIARDAETVTSELTSSAPRKSKVTTTLTDIRDAATAIGSAGAPVAETVTSLLRLFG